MAEPRFYAEFVDDTRQGTWVIGDNDVFDDRFLAIGITKEQAEFGAMMLNNEGIGQIDDLHELKDELYEAIAPVTCVICEKHFMRAQMHDDRCPADQT